MPRAALAVLALPAVAAAASQAGGCFTPCSTDSDCSCGVCWNYACDPCHGARCNTTAPCPNGCSCSWSYCQAPAPTPAPPPPLASYTLQLTAWDLNTCANKTCSYKGATGRNCINDDNCYPVEATCAGDVLNITMYFHTDPGCTADVWRTESFPADGQCHELKHLGFRGVATCA